MEPQQPQQVRGAAAQQPLHNTAQPKFGQYHQNKDNHSHVVINPPITNNGIMGQGRLVRKFISGQNVYLFNKKN